MMKNLLVLMLVLGMASLASATLLTDIGLSLSGNTITVTGYGTTVAKNPVGFGVYVNTSTLGDVPNSTTLTSHANAGDASAIAHWDGWNGVDFTVEDLDPFDGQDGVVLGEWFTFTGTGFVVGDIFNVYDYNTETTLVGTITLTPEPVTLALLGLGGLFLRRKK